MVGGGIPNAGEGRRPPRRGSAGERGASGGWLPRPSRIPDGTGLLPKAARGERGPWWDRGCAGAQRGSAAHAPRWAGRRGRRRRLAPSRAWFELCERRRLIDDPANPVATQPPGIPLPLLAIADDPSPVPILQAYRKLCGVTGMLLLSGQLGVQRRPSSYRESAQ
eukprot:gene12799-biopygen9486